MKLSPRHKQFLVTALIFFISWLPAIVNAQIQKGTDLDGDTAGDWAGNSVAMPDANTLAIGAPKNSGNGTYAGQVKVYSWSGTIWVQKGSDIDGKGIGDEAGSYVSMPDANTVAVASTLGGNVLNAGHVSVYSWNGSVWMQKGTDINGEAMNDNSGNAICMPDANTLAIGAAKNDGNGAEAGHVRVYSWNGSAWVQKGADIDGEAASDYSGTSLSMPDANTIAIGAPLNDGNGNKAGHVRVYSWNGTAWVQKGSDINGEAASDESGNVSMPDANTIAIGAARNDGDGVSSGHVRVYIWNGTSWVQKGTDIDGEVNSWSGYVVSMPHVDVVAVGAPFYDGGQADVGTFRIYRWNGNTWVQAGSDVWGEAYDDRSGGALCMPDANTVAVGASRNDGNGTDAGHVRVYSYNIISGTEQNAEELRVSMHPNPFCNQLFFMISGGKMATVTLYNILGQQMLRQTLTGSSWLNTAEFTQGIYLYEITDVNGLVKAGKVLKQ